MNRSTTIALAASCVSLLTASLPGGIAWVTLLAAMLWIVAALAWALELRVAVVDHPTGAKRGLSATPTIAAIALTAIFLAVPLRLRMELSRSSFEQVPELGLTYESELRIGLYDACCFEWTDYGFRFEVNDTGRVIWGFSYSVSGPPPGEVVDAGLFDSMREGEDRYRRIDGNWYLWQYAYS